MIRRRGLKQKITFDDVAVLIDESSYTEDRLGNRTHTRKETEVFCNVASVTRDQFFAAGDRNYHLDYLVTINAFEYDGQNLVALRGKEFEVVRTYELAGGLLELTLGEKIGDRR